jgi:hypothetical protein
MIDPNDTGGRVFLTVRQLCRRWGDTCHMFVVRRRKSDPDFPRPYRIGKGHIHFFALDEIERYEELGRKEKTHDGKEKPRRRGLGARGKGSNKQDR